jgi:hypothetical protein
MHYPGHIRDAFITWVEAEQPSSFVYEDERRWTARKLLGKLWHCSDVMPGYVCSDLDMAQGSSYAAAAQQLITQWQ